MAASRTKSSVSSNSASVSVGKPAIRSAPMAMPGRSARARAITASASAREMPPRHPLQDQVAAGLQRQMQMRHQPRLLGDQPPQIVVDRRRIDRGQPQPRQFRHQRQQPPDHLAQPRRARQVRAVARRYRRRSARPPGSRRRPARAPARRPRRSARERLGPRPNGMTQNVQRWSQPCCTCTNARARPPKPQTPNPKPQTPDFKDPGKDLKSPFKPIIMASSSGTKAGPPEDEFNKKWDHLQHFQVLRKSKDPRFGEVIVLKHKTKKQLIFSKEKWVTSKAQAAADIQDLKVRTALNHPNMQRFLGYSSAVAKQLCSTNYLVIGYYDFPRSDLYKEIQDKIQTGTEFPADELRLIADEVLGALQFLHQQQKIHGDVRPLHIGIDREEKRVQLLDRLNDPSAEDRAQLEQPPGSQGDVLVSGVVGKDQGPEGSAVPEDQERQLLPGNVAVARRASSQRPGRVQG